MLNFCNVTESIQLQSHQMALTTQLKNQHLLWRAGFGAAAENLKDLAGVSPQKVYAALEKSSASKPGYFDVADNALKGLFMGVSDVVKMEELKKNGLDNETKKKIRNQSREDLKNLNLTWLNQMVNTDSQLREKMSLFWHGHFACRDVNIFFQQLLLDEIRNNALGNFGDLLKGVSKSASMLGFLNNQQNKKQHPNENFAREVMELFTLGRGNYTENDIKEAARAFTGWAFNFKGEFVFRKFQHDSGSKTILGKTGNFDGDDVLNILLEQKQTAKYITKKIYKFFVNENDIDQQKVTWLADRFYQSNYNIGGLMKDIFTSEWFYDEKNIGANIKSPIDLLVGIRRLLPMEIETEQLQLLFQRALGQVLFYPPNVAGWPGGKNWIDSSSLMLRLRIPQLIKDDDTFQLSVKTDDDQQMGMKEDYKKKNLNAMAKGGFQVRANVDWEKYAKQFDGVPREQLYNVIEAVVLQTKQSSVNDSAVKSIVDNSTRENYIKTVTVALMSTPEYQLC
jgi:uncharacterized protein (DUF1800 family)